MNTEKQDIQPPHSALDATPSANHKRGLPAEAGRRRGAQPGNQNAKKHGFYSKALDEAKRREFRQAARVKGLDEEIALLRLKIKSSAEKDSENLKLIGKDVRTLAFLLRAKHAVKDTRADLEEISRNVRRMFAQLYPDSPVLAEWEASESKDME